MLSLTAPMLALAAGLLLTLSPSALGAERDLLVLGAGPGKPTTLWKVDPRTRDRSRVAAGAKLAGAHDLAVSRRGLVYALRGKSVIKVDLGSGRITRVAHSRRFRVPVAIAVAPGGTIYAADPGNNTIFRVNPGTGRVSRVVRLPVNDTCATGIAAVNDRRLLVSCAEAGGVIFRVNPATKAVRKVFTVGEDPGPLALGSRGRLFVGDIAVGSMQYRVFRINRRTGKVGLVVQRRNPKWLGIGDIAFGNDGNVYTCDGSLWRVNPRTGGVVRILGSRSIGAISVAPAPSV